MYKVISLFLLEYEKAFFPFATVMIPEEHELVPENMVSSISSPAGQSLNG